ncbi:MAG: bifunctional nicotinamidase/pyrazinamidase [Ewingella sp.]|uniref:bifunctional nicotinamidase/pyrazinamidase n=1 Tax=Ewingella TaxID=41201 RepID=UPI0033656F0A
MKSALLLIDLQNDFCPGGALAVQEGDATISVANQAIETCKSQGIAVVASQDWHPQAHGSFAVNANEEPWTLGELDGLPQVWWPVHCVQGQRGAEFHPQLDSQQFDHVVRKGQNVAIDSYSAFFDNAHRAATGLHQWLQEKQVQRLIVMGLATDYCVKFTVLDALELGYKVELLVEGCRGVNLNPQDSQQAIDEMQQAGAELTTLADLS